MKLKLFFALFFTGIISNAQHCPYDYSAIIVVKAVSESTGVNIKNLKITLLDENGKPSKTDHWNGNAWEKRDLVFWMNPDTTTFKGYIDNNHPWSPEKVSFHFAEDNYVLICERNLSPEKYKIRVEDTDGKENGEFKTQLYSFGKTDVYPLCSHFSNWSLGEKYGFIEGFKPAVLKLENTK